MVKIYKDWFLTVGHDGQTYDVMKAVEFKEDGSPVRGRTIMNGFYTAAEAIEYVFEAEVREKVKKPELLDLAEFKNMCSELAEEITEKVTSGSVDLRLSSLLKFDPLRDAETRNA